MIEKYLKNISSGKEINYKNFKKICSASGIDNSTIKDIFSAVGMSNNKYVLTVKNHELYDLTFSKFYVENNNTKVQSALRGDSKKNKSPYSILTIKERYNALFGISLFFKDNICTQIPFKLKRKLMIVENANVFCDIQSCFTNSEINLNEYNFVFGSGNSVTDKSFYDFFDSYDEVVCLFDIDLGGFKFYKTLSLNLKTKLTFYFDKENERKLMKFGNPISDDTYLKMNNIYKDIQGLNKIISIVNKHKKFAEQEIFQHSLTDV